MNSGSSTISPIPTVWNGWRFRSRLEARWAIYFDTLGIPYEYELEGYEVAPGVCYLPDFYLPEHRCYAEVKGKRLTDEESSKVLNFVRSTNECIILLVGSPEYAPYFRVWRDPTDTNNIFKIDRVFPCLAYCNAIYPFENTPQGFPDLSIDCIELWYGWEKKRCFWVLPCANEAGFLKNKKGIVDPVVASRQFKKSRRCSSSVVRC